MSLYQLNTNNLLGNVYSLSTTYIAIFYIQLTLYANNKEPLLNQVLINALLNNYRV